MAQQLLSTVPQPTPGGKMDARDIAMQHGVTPELLPHMLMLKEEEKKLRADWQMKQDKLKKSLREWEKMEREAKLNDLRLELSEKLMRKYADESTDADDSAF